MIRPKIHGAIHARYPKASYATLAARPVAQVSSSGSCPCQLNSIHDSSVARSCPGFVAMGNCANCFQGVDGLKRPSSARRVAPYVVYTNQKRQLEEVYSREDKPLGEGSFGKVWAGRHYKSNEKYAIKGVGLQHFQGQKDQIKDAPEVKTMQSLDHPNIVRVAETFQDKKYFYLVMEFCSGGDMYERLNQISETGKSIPMKVIARYMRDILSAVAHMHWKAVGHFDLKLENLLLSDRTADALVKITDFGLAQLLPRGETGTRRAGSKYYVAPEVLAGNYDPRADNWSCGVLLFTLMFDGAVPFDGDNTQQILHKIQNAPVVIPNTPHSKAANLVQSLLQRDLKERLTARKAVQHGWFRDELGGDDIPQLPQQIFDGLEKMAEIHSFKRMLWKAIVDRTEDINAIREFQDQFRILDSHKQGFLSVKDLMVGFGHLDVNRAASQEESSELEKKLEKVMKTITALQSSCQLQYSEFVAAALLGMKFKPTDKALMSTFSFFDRNGRDKITPEDIDRVLLHDVEKHDKTTLLVDIAEVDLDQDGALSYSEFLAFLGIQSNWGKLMGGMKSFVAPILEKFRTDDN